MVQCPFSWVFAFCNKPCRIELQRGRLGGIRIPLGRFRGARVKHVNCSDQDGSDRQWFGVFDSARRSDARVGSPLSEVRETGRAFKAWFSAARAVIADRNYNTHWHYASNSEGRHTPMPGNEPVD